MKIEIKNHDSIPVVMIKIYVLLTIFTTEKI